MLSFFMMCLQANFVDVTDCEVCLPPTEPIVHGINAMNKWLLKSIHSELLFCGYLSSSFFLNKGQWFVSDSFENANC